MSRRNRLATAIEIVLGMLAWGFVMAMFWYAIGVQ
jgi:hypothetical protein